MGRENKGIRISFNSPVILIFSIASLLVLGISYMTGGVSDRLLFCVYRSSLSDPLTYFRFFGHVLGHANWEHFLSNIMMILVVGPLLEEKYGSTDTLFVILTTAFVTGLIHFIFFPNVALLGASGIVFIACKYDEYRRWQNSAYFYSCRSYLYRRSDTGWNSGKR